MQAPDAPERDPSAKGLSQAAPFSRRVLLRWAHLGRLLVVGLGVAWAMGIGRAGSDREAVIITGLLLGAAVLATLHSLRATREGRPEPTDFFVFAQVAFDAVAVAVLVHLSAGLFTPLFILVIAGGALLLPLAGGVALGALAGLLYLTDVLLFDGAGAVGLGLIVQIALFGLVALTAGFVGDRLRLAGRALGEAESELRQLRHTTSDILGTISAGVLTVDGEGRLVYLNPSGEKLLRLRASDWEARPVVEAVRDVAPELGALLDRSIGQGVAYARRTSRLLRREGVLTLGVSTAVLAQPGSQRPSVTAIFQDITDQERLAELNRRAERLEAVAELSASLAHEIKNPLASIRSAVEQLSGPNLEPPDEEVLQTLVLRESDRLSRLLSDFLEFSGLRIGETEPVELRRLLSECVEVARQHPEASDGPSLEVTLTDEPVFVRGDPDLLHRALFNLVLNAVQFAGQGGTVQVGISDVGGAPRGVDISNPIRIWVRDSGPGIAPEHAERIFDPFYTTRRGGTGLGLAVVHRAVEAHEGAVFVDPSDAGGTEFVLLLPGVGPDGFGEGVIEPGAATVTVREGT